MAQDWRNADLPKAVMATLSEYLETINSMVSRAGIVLGKDHEATRKEPEQTAESVSRR